MPKKASILFIGPFPPPFSGPELSMKQFLESEVLNASFTIHFLRTNMRDSNVNKGKIGLSTIAGTVRYYLKLIRFLLMPSIQAVYYPITPTQIGWLGRDAWTILLASLFSKKVIIHLRGSHFKLNYATFSAFAQKLVAYAISKVAIAIVQAEYLKDQFNDFIPEKRIKVLYQAMDVQEFTNPDVASFEFGRILSIGHQTKAKGYTDLLKVIPEIADEYPEVCFQFAGNMRKGERGVFFNQLTNEKIAYEDPFQAEATILSSPYARNYKNLNIIDGEEKMEAFRKAHIYVTTSYSEGFSRALLEAMAMGKALIYTPVGAHREVLEDGVHGICVEPGNLNQIREAIKRLLSNPDLCKSMALNNYQTVREKYSIEHIAESFAGVLRLAIKDPES